MLITVNVLGSTGPLRFLVYEDEVVSTVINLTLKSYAREGRLPVLGSNLNDFLLYCPTSDTSDGNCFIRSVSSLCYVFNHYGN